MEINIEWFELPTNTTNSESNAESTNELLKWVETKSEQECSDGEICCGKCSKS